MTTTAVRANARKRTALSVQTLGSPVYRNAVMEKWSEQKHVTTKQMTAKDAKSDVQESLRGINAPIVPVTNPYALQSVETGGLFLLKFVTTGLVIIWLHCLLKDVFLIVLDQILSGIVQMGQFFLLRFALLYAETDSKSGTNLVMLDEVQDVCQIALQKK